MLIDFLLNLLLIFGMVKNVLVSHNTAVITRISCTSLFIPWT